MHKMKKFVQKNVKIIDIDNDEWQGRVIGLDYAINNDTEYDELILKPSEQRSGVVSFFENEIKSIEVI